MKCCTPINKEDDSPVPAKDNPIQVITVDHPEDTVIEDLSS